MRLRGVAIAYASRVVDAPIELIALDQPSPGLIAARREGEPSFTHVQGVGDALAAALARGVDLVIPADIADGLAADLPPDFPDWVRIQ